MKSNKPEKNTKQEVEVIRKETILPCGCKYQLEKDWGYDLQKRVPPPKHWEGIGWGSLETVNKVLRGRTFKALVRCRGCGAELIREY